MVRLRLDALIRPQFESVGRRFRDERDEREARAQSGHNAVCRARKFVALPRFGGQALGDCVSIRTNGIISFKKKKFCCISGD